MIDLTKSEVIRAAQEAAGIDAKDTGSPEVQISLLTWKIACLQNHLQHFSKDKTAQRRLLFHVHSRRTLLSYLERIDSKRHLALATRLGIRIRRQA